MEAFELAGGEYENQPLCSTCSRELVEENLQLLRKQHSDIKRALVFMGIGAAIGAVNGFSLGMVGGALYGLLFGLLGAFVGGSIGEFLQDFKNVLIKTFRFNDQAAKENLDQDSPGCALVFVYIVPFIVAAIGALIMSPFRAIPKLIRYINYLKETEGFMESDTENLNLMDQYLRFTIALDQYPGTPVEQLAQMGGPLEGNAFVPIYLESGQQAVEQQVQQAADSIAQNSNVIMEFEIAENGEVVRRAA